MRRREISDCVLEDKITKKREINVCLFEDKILRRREITDGQTQQDEPVRCLSECFCKKIFETINPFQMIQLFPYGHYRGGGGLFGQCP